MTKLAAAKQQETGSPQTTLIVLAVIGIGGMGLAWILQLVQGMGITGMGQQVVWGLYIAGFFAAMGAGAALVVLTAMSEFVPVLPIATRRQALLLALAGFVVGGILIAMDVGNPVNLWRILTAGRFTSMMTWDFLVLIVTGVLTLVYLYASWKQEGSTSSTRTLGVLALIGATMLIVVEGWMLATLTAHPLWMGGMTIVNFLVLAMTAGFALAIISWEETAMKLAGWLKIALWVTFGLFAVELLTIIINTNVRPGPEVSLSLAGNLGAMFWFYLIIGLALPLVILYWRKDLIWLRVAAGLALLGVLAEKLWLLSAGQAMPWLPLPQVSYAPSWVEVVGILGVFVLGIFIYRLLLGIFKVGAR